MEIITSRLKIVCISKRMYKSLVKTNRYGNMTATSAWPSYDAKKIIETDLKAYKGIHELMKWSVWAVVLKDTGEIIGSAGFKGVPNIKGEVEICYEISQNFRNRGYCFEATSALIHMASHDVRVDLILADCLIENKGSIKVLEKLDFKVHSNDEKNMYWEKK